MTRRVLSAVVLFMSACGDGSQSGAHPDPSCPLRHAPGVDLAVRDERDECLYFCRAPLVYFCNSPQPSCVDVQTDRNNCGRCDRVCPTTMQGTPYACVRGGCIPP